MRDSMRFRPSTPRLRSGPSLSGVEGSTVLGTLSLPNGRRTVMNKNAGEVSSHTADFNSTPAIVPNG